MHCYICGTIVQPRGIVLRAFVLAAVWITPNTITKQVSYYHCFLAQNAGKCQTQLVPLKAHDDAISH